MSTGAIQGDTRDAVHIVRNDVSRTNCAEQSSGADRANGSFLACGCRPWRGGSPPLRLSPAMGHDAEMFDVSDPELGRRTAGVMRFVDKPFWFRRSIYGP